MNAVSLDADQEKALALLTAFATQDTDHRPKLMDRLLRRKAEPTRQGFYLHGDVGRGKTMVMDRFFSSAPEPKKRRVHFHAFMLEVHDFLHARRTARTGQKGMDDALLACAAEISNKTRLLCLDEFHVRDVADAMILGRLFSALFAKDLKVVMTSNAAPDDLYKDGLQRDRFLPFIALLKDRLTLLHFGGATDYRLNRLRGAQTYYSPAGQEATEKMRAIFLDLADGMEPEPVRLTVKEREILIPLAAREGAWFTFAELCETPKSALDYLELARRYSVFFIRDIPPLDDGKHNAVLRFITAIDALYDCRARAIVSAAVPLENLYTGDMHGKAFGRTASRLTEMQAAHYGAP